MLVTGVKEGSAVEHWRLRLRQQPDDRLLHGRFDSGYGVRGDPGIMAESFEPEDIGLAAEPCELALGRCSGGLHK
jgi:hypothetical protein